MSFIPDDCVVCGKLVDGRHKCDPRYIQRVEAARKSHSELGRYYPPSYSTRLATGFDMMKGEPI